MRQLLELLTVTRGRVSIRTSVCETEALLTTRMALSRLATDRMSGADSHVVNVASVPHRSPFRYPGGKTWLVPFVRDWMDSLPNKPSVLCEPFCGGASVGLSMLFDGLVEHLVLVELDEDVSAVWQAMLNGDADGLVAKIGEFEVTQDSVRAILATPPKTTLERAFATIVRNRVQRGGILAPGASLMKRGEAGRGLKSRWYAQTLQKRIRNIASLRGRITFILGDGLRYLRDNAGRSDIAFLIDPPYTVAGRRLYLHSMIDHEQLFENVSKLRGEFLMTYDDAMPVELLAERHSFDFVRLPMKNTHHRIMYELVIGRDLGWARVKA